METLLNHTRRPDITFCRNGRIFISARVARLLDISPGDSINISVTDGEFLLFAMRHPFGLGRHIARCYPTKKHSRNLSANSVELCLKFFAACNIQAQRAAFMTGEPLSCGETTYLPIITRHPIIK
ncbi:AbrB/MazE/SpoVT family DNA-binding domain-containing protein [uncultured Duncaniella sp.]|uniref:AbrB/MazE/SpoVT family DNA-binding domain-containing protein n=1 Tax=uncultured Duncaniella sp. TaxID=2768039 RepID=UPI002657AF24|nr:AbrB/MazE/SpoVT family DNA-binding domain-containing protein [uncultured Duncaniella sp.]